MSTHSVIGVMHGEKCKAVYCHWDGYLSNNGAILLEHYDSAKANHLVSLGNLSSLEKNVVPAEGVEHSFNKPAKDVCVFYDRDRNEGDQEFEVFHSLAEMLEHYGEEHYYIMKDGVWYYTDNYGVIVSLRDAMGADGND